MLTQGAKVLVLDPVDGKAAGVDRQQREGAERAGHRLRPAHHGRRSTTTSPSTTRRSASCRRRPSSTAEARAARPPASILMVNGSPTDNNAGQFKKGAHSVLDDSGYKVAGRVRHPGLGARTRPRQWMAGQITHVQGPDQGRLRGQRRHRRRRDRGAEGRRRQPAPAGHRPGRRARGHPAHPRRRAVHDRLQGRSSRRPRTPPSVAVGAGAGPGEGRHRRPRHTARACPSVAAHPGRRHQGQHRGHRRQGRVLQRVGSDDLHRRVQ